MNNSHSALETIARRDISETTDLWPQIAAHIERKEAARMNPKLRLAWTFVLVLLVLLAITGVAYAVGSMLGYIPGVGLVQQGASIRVLAEPVSVTRNGVTVGVTQVIITGDKTSLSYGVLGVPHGAYPDREDIVGCFSSAYLRLPDGTKMDSLGNMPPIPANIDTATFVLPCIGNTLPGTVPVNWELPLRFVPAPPNLTVVPVTEILPSPAPATLPQETAPAARENPLVVTKVLEIGDSYVIMGEFRYSAGTDPTLPVGSWWTPVNVSRITDATGQSVPYTFPNDIDAPTPIAPDTETWIYQVQKGFAPPLTFTYQGEVISPVGPKEQAQFEFDAGPDPKSGDQWPLNQDFKMGGYNIRLVSISFDTRGGYSFQFKADPGASANAISVDILGYTPDCGGGGGGPDDFPVEFTRSVCFWNRDTTPKGKLTGVLSFQALVRKNKSFSVQWAPDTTLSGPFETPTAQPGVCVTRRTLSQLAAAPHDLKGRVLLQDDQTGNMLLSNLDGTQKQDLKQADWPAFLPDGAHLSYGAPDGLYILDIATGQTDSLKGAATAGYNLQWSPKGTQLAFVDDTNGDIFVSAADGTHLRRLTNNADYKTLVGWSPDETQLYITAQGLDGWILRAIDMAGGATRDLFTLKDASVKAPNVTISPDGQWFAYRDRNLNSLYLVRSDGTQAHVLVDQASAGISTGFWSADGKWLAVGLLNFDNNSSTVLLVQPDTCQAYVLPALHGTLEGLQLP